MIHIRRSIRIGLGMDGFNEILGKHSIRSSKAEVRIIDDSTSLTICNWFRSRGNCWPWFLSLSTLSRLGLDRAKERSSCMASFVIQPNFLSPKDTTSNGFKYFIARSILWMLVLLSDTAYKPSVQFQHHYQIQIGQINVSVAPCIVRGCLAARRI